MCEPCAAQDSNGFELLTLSYYTAAIPAESTARSVSSCVNVKVVHN